MTLFNLNILGKMGFAALGGFEYVAIFAGESRDPAKIIGRSVWISAPVVALIFILGTGAVLFYVPMDVDRPRVARAAGSRRSARSLLARRRNSQAP